MNHRGNGWILLGVGDTKEAAAAFEMDGDFSSGEKLFDIKGRARGEQLDLAEEMGISEFVKSPGGGCILTEDVYSRRLKDYLKHKKEREIQREEMFLLNVGRHFRKDTF